MYNFLYNFGYKFFVASCMFIAALQALNASERPNTEKKLPMAGPEHAQKVWLETIETYAATNQWRHLAHITKTAIEEGVSLGSVKDLAEKIEIKPFLKAINATQNIRDRLGDVAIAKGELFRIALFIETELEDACRTLGSNYLSRRNTGLDRTIQYDPESKQVYIHLKNLGVDEIGRGVKKIVTKSVLYDVKRPEYVARCVSSSKMGNEIMALKLMQGSKGILKVFSYSERTTKKRQKVFSMICKLYKAGSLDKALSDGYQFTFRQKLEITRDLLQGLAAMQAKGLVHRDLTARNVFLDNNKKGARKKRRFKAVIADFGRTRHIDQATGVKVQFNSRYLAPEGLIAERLAGEDYYQTDLFALGCILHKLHYEKSGPWIDKSNLKNPTQPDAVKEAKFIYDLERYREVRLAKLALSNGFGFNSSLKDRYEELILQCVHPDPKKRGTAKEHLGAIQQIINEFEEKARLKNLPAEEELHEELTEVDQKDERVSGFKEATDRSDFSISNSDLQMGNSSDLPPPSLF